LTTIGDKNGSGVLLEPILNLVVSYGIVKVMIESCSLCAMFVDLCLVVFADVGNDVGNFNDSNESSYIYVSKFSRAIF